MRDWLRRGAKAPPDKSATTQLRAALHLVLAGDLAGAEAALAEAARVDSSSSDVYLALANLYRLRGDIGRAIQIHQNLMLRSDLSSELRREALLGLALDFRAGGFHKRAAASFQELLEVEPDNLQALRALERIRIDSGDWQGALEVRAKIAGRDPASHKVTAHLWVGHGRSRATRGADAEARRAFKKALAQDPECAEAYLALGDQRMREQKWKKASALFGRALGLHAAIGTLLYPRLFEAHQKLADLPGLERILRERLDAAPDDSGVREVARLSLERAGYRALCAAGGDTALRMLREHADIGLVLLDLSLGSESGEEVLEAIRKVAEHTPVLATSGYAAAEAFARLERHGIAGFMPKPFTPAELARAVAEALRVTSR
jgi:lipopolysaccharide biosynthesis regulator YciM